MSMQERQPAIGRLVWCVPTAVVIWSLAACLIAPHRYEVLGLSIACGAVLGMVASVTLASRAR